MKRHLACEAAILIDNIAFSGASIPEQHQRIGDCIALPDAHKICPDHRRDRHLCHLDVTATLSDINTPVQQLPVKEGMSK